MDHVLVLSSPPILGQETIASADDLSIKISGELRPVICQAPDPEIAAEGGGSEIDIHDGYVDVVAVPTTFLGPLEGSAWVETIMTSRTNT